jgi:hypothetical protein
MSPSTMRSRALGAAACLGVAVSAALLVPTSANASAETGASRARTVRDWNAIAIRTITAPTEGNQAPAPAQLYLGLVSSAVHDALDRTVPGRASVSAAVATAAHDVLLAYFPGSTTALHAAHEATLASVPDGPLQNRGVAVGAAAADRLLDSRDPLPLSITFPVDPDPEPGEWRPTPPAFAPMAFPWLGFVDPLLLPSPTSIDPGGPDALDSADYAADLDEVRRVGGTGSTDPGADAANGLFWNAPVGVVFNTALRDWADRADLGARSTARMFALLNMTAADSIIACWRQKYDEAFWRPVTAIQLADPTWTPVVATPPYPEWPTGHGCLTSAFTHGLTRLTGSDAIDLFITNPAMQVTRHYTSAAALRQSAFLSRIQLGIHFRDGMEDGYTIGRLASKHGFAAFNR